MKWWTSTQDGRSVHPEESAMAYLVSTAYVRERWRAGSADANAIGNLSTLLEVRAEEEKLSTKGELIRMIMAW
jgi:hypothetical protein